MLCDSRWLKAVLATLVNCVMHLRVQEGFKKARCLGPLRGTTAI